MLDKLIVALVGVLEVATTMDSECGMEYGQGIPVSVAARQLMPKRRRAMRRS